MLTWERRKHIEHTEAKWKSLSERVQETEWERVFGRMENYIDFHLTRFSGVMKDSIFPFTIFQPFQQSSSVFLFSSRS